VRNNLLQETHNKGLAGNFGSDKTYVELREDCFWLGMSDDLKFVKRCMIFDDAKERHQNTRLYQPLHILDRLWDAIRMDFVLGFLRTQGGNVCTFVVVDRFSKAMHYK